LGFVKRDKKVIMMEKTLILKHISRMLCLLISYSKFTRTKICMARMPGIFAISMAVGRRPEGDGKG
jgi:hypothetical protein